MLIRYNIHWVKINEIQQNFDMYDGARSVLAN